MGSYPDLDKLADAVADRVMERIGGGGDERPECMSTRELAAMIGLGEITLQQMRHRGEGPPFVKLGRRVIYRRADVDAWLAENRKGAA